VNPKIARDPYLRGVCERHGDEAAFEAGFFEDSDPDDAPLDDVDWLCTPTAHVRRHLDALGSVGGGGVPVVLVSTGGFFPVHSGHLAMMAAARRAAEDAGLRVVGGYLSPGHDEYIARKCGSVPVGASSRLALADAAVASSGWLAVDPWEALGRRVAVNYTDVTARLERYLRTHVDPSIEVAFVCGGDNARFALAFSQAGRCIVVGRPGHEATVARWRDDPRLPGDGHILWVHGDDPAASIDLRPVPEVIRPRRLRLRLEDERAVATLGLATPAWRTFQQELVGLLEGHLELETAIIPDPPDPDGGPPTISLDPFVPGDADLAVSRLFDVGGYRLLGHVARPGSAPVEEQVAAVPPGEWRLFDDDRSTGSTVEFVRSRLPHTVVVREAAFLVDDAGAEVADSRDFLLGTDHGGLVVALPDGTVGRAPYLLPFVDPAVRCSIPDDHALAFSHGAWALNAETFRSTDLRIRDLPPAAARTLRAAGHPPDAPLHEVCDGYAARLAHLMDGAGFVDQP
jgi:nicotinic acid mononucleotide adenylyltransferase